MSDIIANRKHRTLVARENQLYYNLLALSGGRPYIDERLDRHPAESYVDWGGSKESLKSRFNPVPAAIPSVGRRDWSFLVNRAGRVAEKVRQYVYATPPEREGIPDDIARDITRCGDSINAFMGDVLRHLVACKWCWIGVDAPEVDGDVSIAEAERGNLRPYWVLYSPLDVVDWRFDESGKLKWILTEGTVYDNDDPNEEPSDKIVRRLWRPGIVTEYEIEVESVEERKIISTRTVEIDIDEVPFVPVGKIASSPHWYDDVEGQQRGLLNLESILQSYLRRVVFAQLVLPESVKDAATGEAGGTQMQKPVGAIISELSAIVEGTDEKGISRYIGPDAAALQAFQGEVNRLDRSLYDTAGLHLGFSRDFSESSEATRLDHLDPQSVMRQFAQQIQEAEMRAVALTGKLGGPTWTVRYADNFSFSNIYEDWKSLVLASQLDAPTEFQRLVLEGACDALLRITNLNISDDQKKTLKTAIENFDPMESIGLDVGRIDDGVRKQATDDGEGLVDD